MACRVRNIRTSHEQRRRASSAFLHDTAQLNVPHDALHTRRGSANSIHDGAERRPTLGSLQVADLKYSSLTPNARRRSSLAPPSPTAGLARRRSAPERPSFSIERGDSNDNMELKKSNVFAILLVACAGLLLVMLFASYIKGFRLSA